MKRHIDDFHIISKEIKEALCSKLQFNCGKKNLFRPATLKFDFFQNQRSDWNGYSMQDFKNADD
jgi:hypothetical protein